MYDNSNNDGVHGDLDGDCEGLVNVMTFMVMELMAVIKMIMEIVSWYWYWWYDNGDGSGGDSVGDDCDSEGNCDDCEDTEGKDDTDGDGGGDRYVIDFHSKPNQSNPSYWPTFLQYSFQYCPPTLSRPS